MPPKWWTEADQSELELLIHELVRTAFIHRERCAICSAAPVEGVRATCDPMLEAIACVLDWREGRIMRSKAAWLRALEDRKEWSGQEPPRTATGRAA